MPPIPRIRRRQRAFAATLVLLTTTLLPVALAVVAAPWAVRPAVAQERSAVVRGASKVFVRRGPGMSFPPFARLAEGSVVQIKGQQGQWVRIMTTGGQMGFVNAKYLLMVDRNTGEIEPPADEAEAEEEIVASPTAVIERKAPTAVPTAPPTPRATATRTTLPARAAAAAKKQEEAAPPVTAPSTVIPRLPPPEPSRATMAEERAAIADEIRRLTEAVAALQRRIEENEPIDNGFSEASADDGSSVSGGAILLGLLGVGLGWYLGGRYGRAQERGRRSRIRF
jgi:hypothetical protein